MLKKDHIRILIHLLKDKVCQLPLKQPDENIHFPKFMENIYTKFLEGVQHAYSEGCLEEKEKEEMEVLCDTIKDVIDNYYKGFTVDAFKQFSEILTNQEKVLLSLYDEVSDHGSHFYRIRVGKHRILKTDEMFHVPFDKRRVVSSQRYSIPGLPCLYLGSSSYICWEELGQPDLKKVQAVRLFKADHIDLNLLDFSLTPQSFAATIEGSIEGDLTQNELREYLNLILNYIVSWPIISACSVIVRDKDAPFKPEYIIPQLLLQWIQTKTHIDGIKYFSVARKLSEQMDPELKVNYAFPVKTNKSKGLCSKLTNYFYITDSVGYHLYEDHRKSRNDQQLSKPKNLRELAAKETCEEYDYTEFGKLDSLLNQEKLHSIK